MFNVLVHIHWFIFQQLVTKYLLWHSECHVKHSRFKCKVWRCVHIPIIIKTRIHVLWILILLHPHTLNSECIFKKIYFFHLQSVNFDFKMQQQFSTNKKLKLGEEIQENSNDNNKSYARIAHDFLCAILLIVQTIC